MTAHDSLQDRARRCRNTHFGTVPFNQVSIATRGESVHSVSRPVGVKSGTTTIG